MNRSVYKERFKTIIIVVLFLLTVLLSYFYWQGSSLYSLKDSVNEHFSGTLFTGDNSPDAASFVGPKAVEINFGNGLYTRCQEDADLLWKEFINSYIDFSEMQNLMIEEISEAQWLETMDMKSIQFIFEYDLPVTFFEMLGGSNFGQTDHFSNISAMALSEASITSLFIKDDSQNKFYRIISDSEFYPLEEKIREIGNSVSDQYYPVCMLLGTDNYEMAPFGTDILLPELYYTNASAENIVSSEKDLAKSFFGETLDFVRRVVDDSGTITYMYGYGEKMLTIYKNGTFEYKETPSSTENASDFQSILETAVSFISSHGGWSSFGTEKISPQLRSVEKASVPKVDTYNLIFSSEYDNCTLYGSPSSQIIIELTGNQVTYYKRSMVSFDDSVFSENYPEITENYPVSEILAQEHQKLAQLLLEHNAVIPDNKDEDIFNMIVGDISSINTGYYSQKTDAGIKFIPSWVIDFSGFKTFYSLYTGEYLGFINETEQ